VESDRDVGLCLNPLCSLFDVVACHQDGDTRDDSALPGGSDPGANGWAPPEIIRRDDQALHTDYGTMTQ